MPNPQCCDYAKKYILLRYAEYYTDNPRHFLETIPFWRINGSRPEQEDYIPASEESQIHFCPNCGKKLPQIKMKEVLPEKVMVISDGGYYCDTCGERLHACTCTHPEEMWELDEYKPDPNDF